MSFLLTAYAFLVAGLVFAVAALCWGWPRGELWPLETRFAGAAMALAGLTTVASALLMAGIQAEAALYAFTVGAIAAFVAGTCSVIPSDTPHARRRRVSVVLVALALIGVVVALQRSLPASLDMPGTPKRLLTPASALLFALACGGFQALEALAIAAYWPRSQARSSLIAGITVFVAGFLDIAALLGRPVPLLGAVTSAAIASSYVASRMLAQFRVALQGAEGRVPGYALQRFLGAGGMAEVFAAEAVGLLGQKRVAAVKRVRRDLVDNAELCAMFLDEARLAVLLRHPNIVEVYSFGTGTPGSAVRPYIAMELVDGMPLSTLVKYCAALRRPIPLGVVGAIGVALCSALHYAHNLRDKDGSLLRIVHRDVSPHNVLISRSGEIKLIDFGIARAATRAGHTKAGHMRGKLAYAAPEQISGDVDARSDVFSLGVLLYEAAALTRPFSGDSDVGIVGAILQGRCKRLVDVRADAAPLADAIERAMQADPDERWQSAQAFEQALRTGLHGELADQDMLAQLVMLVDEQRHGVSGPPSLPPPSLGSYYDTTSEVSAPSDTATVADPAPAVRSRRT